MYGTGKTGDDQRVELVLDIAVPNTETAALRPLMVQIHGGGSKKGSRIGFGKDLFDRAAQRGWVVASIDYRLMGDDPLPRPQMQEMLDAMGDDASDPDQYRAAVAAVEVYPRPHSAPPQYGAGGDCGVVLFWLAEPAASSRGWDKRRLAVGVAAAFGIFLLSLGNR